MDQPDQAELMESETTAMEQEPIFVSLSSDVQELLADNRIDLVDELRNLGVEVAKGDVAAPHTDEGGSAKEVTLVILASAAAFSAVCIGVARIIDALGRNKKVIVTEQECVPMRDESGAILRDKNGLPRMSWVKKSR